LRFIFHIFKIYPNIFLFIEIWEGVRKGKNLLLVRMRGLGLGHRRRLPRLLDLAARWEAASTGGDVFGAPPGGTRAIVLSKPIILSPI
jgi:hypothetical protein